MNCGVGDKVRFLNEVGGGRITKILDKNKVLVLTDDGFEIPTLASEIVVVELGDEKLKAPMLEQKPTTESKQNSKPIAKKSVKIGVSLKDEYRKSLLENNLVLAIIPGNEAGGYYPGYKLYLVNNSGYHILYSISQIIDSLNHHILQGELLYMESILIKEFKEIEPNVPSIIKLQLISYMNGQYTCLPPEEVTIDTKLFLHSDYKCFLEPLNTWAYCITLNDIRMKQEVSKINQNEIRKIVEQKDDTSKPLIRKHVQTEIEEIDLHIHEIVDNYKNLTPGEIIKIQLDRFETSIESGIRSKTLKKMVFIHGLGNGKLKHELRKLLDTKYKRLKYQDASFKEYGYGATLVYLK